MSKLKYYVYGYYDPRDGTPIYFGKGTGKRACDHLKKALNPGLAEAIFEYRALGLEPIVIIEEYFPTAVEAWAREIELIAYHGRRIYGRAKP